MTDPMETLRRRFRARATEQADTLAHALEAEDRATVTALSHKLAGSAAVFGVAEIGVLAGVLEQEAERGSGWDALQKIAAPLLAQLHHAAQGTD